MVCCEGLVWHRTFDNHAGRDYWYTNPGIGFCRTSWTQPRRKVTIPIPLSPSLFRDNLDNSCLQWPVVLADSTLVRSHECGQVIDVQGASGSILGVHSGSFSGGGHQWLTQRCLRIMERAVDDLKRTNFRPALFDRVAFVPAWRSNRKIENEEHALWQMLHFEDVNDGFVRSMPLLDLCEEC